MTLNDRYWAALAVYCSRQGQVNDMELEFLRKEVGLAGSANDVWESLNIRKLIDKIEYVEAANIP
jgi:hypothetical protein